MKKKLGIVCVVVAAIFWGMLGIFVRNITKSGFDSLEIVAIRAIGATTLLAIYFAIFDRNAFKIKFKDIWVFLGTGIGSMVFFNFCYFGSINRTSLAVAAALLYTAPAFVGVLAGIFLKEKLTRYGVIAIVLAILGCMLTSGIITNFKGVDVIGFLLGIGSGLGYALYSIFGKFAVRKGYKSSTTTFYTFLVASLCTSFSLIDSPLTSGEQRDGSFSLPFILSIAGLIVISTIAAYILYTKGLENVKADTAAVFASIEPVVATIFSITLFHEHLTVDVIIGLCCILASTFVVSRE